MSGSVLDRQTVAGALGTGTHGTGREFGGLATFVAPPMLYTSVPFVAPPAPSK